MSIDTAVQTDAKCLEAVRQNGLNLQYVIKQTEVICLAAVQQNGLKEPNKLTQFYRNIRQINDSVEFIKCKLTITENSDDVVNCDELYTLLKSEYSEMYSTKCTFTRDDMMDCLKNNNYVINDSCIFGVKLNVWKMAYGENITDNNT